MLGLAHSQRLHTTRYCEMLRSTYGSYQKCAVTYMTLCEAFRPRMCSVQDYVRTEEETVAVAVLLLYVALSAAAVRS